MSGDRRAGQVWVPVVLLVGATIVSWGLGACGGRRSSAAPTSAENLPVCEDPGPMPPRFRWWPNDYSPCPSGADVEAIRRDIPITFSSNVPESPVVCGADQGVELTWIQERLYTSILFMRALRFDTTLPWTNLDLYGWFRKAIAGIVVERGEVSVCCSPPRVIRIRVPEFAQNYTWRRAVDTQWEGVLVHEARHAEGMDHTCLTDHSKDARVTDMGPYGVCYWLAFWIAEHSGQSEEVREWYRYGYKKARLAEFCLECANATALVPADFLLWAPLMPSRP